MTDPQRAAFETWASSEEMSTATGNCGWYVADGTAKAWRAWVAAQAADAGREAVAAIIEHDGTGYGRRKSVVLIEQYDPRDPSFWTGGVMADGYSFTLCYAHPPVAAINAELVEALEACTAAMLARGVSTDPEHPDRIAFDKARAALSRAKEQM